MSMSTESSFICVPLEDDIKHKEQILEFTIDREAGYSQSKNSIIGLEAYLKRCAWDEDSNHEVKIYLIKDINNGSIAAYFGLKAGMVASSGSESLSPEQKAIILKSFKREHLFPEVLPGIEISHFAVNDDYRRRVSKDSSKLIKGLAAYFYPAFIYPIIEDVANKIGVTLIYLYAAGDHKLVSYYKKVFGFEALQEKDFYIPLEPRYDDGCTFMYRLLP